MDNVAVKGLETLIRSEYGNIVGIVLHKDGARIYENYFNGYNADNAIHVYSVTKSVFSSLIGIAIHKGYIKDVEQKVLRFFPEYAVKPGEKTVQNITIKNLLTMTAPYKYVTEPYEEFFSSQDPIHLALDLLGGDGAIGAFNYSAIGGTHILSGILARTTGMHVLDFAVQHLFSPLGIDVANDVLIRSKEEHFEVMNDRNTKGWVVDPQGMNTASWGLFLTPADMAKFGQLYLNDGTWNGHQVLPAGWVAESTREHSRCVAWGNLAYGYLWWIIDEDSYAALGDGGNVIYVNTRTNVVVSIASLYVPDAKDRIELIKNHIEPRIQA